MKIENFETYSLTYNNLRTVPDDLRQLEPYVNIGAVFSSNGDFLGSGFLLNSGHFITALHVCKGQATIEVRFLSNNIPLKLTNHYMVGDDIAAYDSGIIDGRPGFMLGNPKENTQIWVIGFPLRDQGRSLSISHGVIISLQRGTIVHDASTVNHQSGGPLIDINDVSTVYGVILEQLNVAGRNGAGIIDSTRLS